MEITPNIIRENFQRVTEQIHAAARSAGREPGDVRLVVVTKAQPAAVIRAVIEAGAQIVGENYPEETLPKIQELGRVENVEWHMIGHLQSRKSAFIADHFDMLQSLDSLRLAERLERQCSERGRVLPVLLELNVGGEESKSGWQAADESALDRLLPEIEAILRLPHLVVRGLMTMPPLYDDPEQTRPFFAQLRSTGEVLAARFGTEHFQELSMGTSADFIAAVQEGATLVRVGTAIVGPRPPKGV
jgi:PLP dependent protein